LQSQAHENQPCSELQAYGIAHKGKATSDVTFSVDDPPEAYNNPTIQPRITKYVTTAREVRGLDFNPVTKRLDGESIVMSGEGRMHGWYNVGDSLLVRSSIPTLAAVRSRERGTSSTPPMAHCYTDVARAVLGIFVVSVIH
jgi:type V secretory pathway adhesin AidA